MSVEPKKSPLRRPPLRQAGQSVQEEIDRIWEDKIEYHLLMFAALVGLTVMDWLGWLFKAPRLPLFTTLVMVGYGIFAAFRIRPLIKHHHRLRLGRDGERVVGQELEKLRAHGFRVYHDFLGDSFNIDHIVVGPTGVFTVNTKTISKPNDPSAKIDYDGEVIRIPGTKLDRNPIAQARAEGDFVRKWIRDIANREAPVRPAVAFVGWFTAKQPTGAEVWVLNVTGLVSFIRNERSELSQDDIYHISRALEDHIIHKQKQLSSTSMHTTWSEE